VAGITLAPPATVTVTAQTVVERGHLLPGFSLTLYAEVAGPTSLAFGPDQRLYASTENGLIYAVADLDDDQRGDAIRQFASGFSLPLGLLWIGNELYVSDQGRVVALRDDNGDGAADNERVVVSGLPSDGLHSNDGLALGEDGFIYMGQGSTCDHCVERDPRSGAILRFRRDGSGLAVYARGLRNPYDLAFNDAGDLFATDNGRDDLGRDEPGEELNLIRRGQQSGQP
jgi:glucose/arabinose dehydrogenase